MAKIVVFAAVGLLASAIHILVAWLLMFFLGVSVFICNLFGFLTAFVISYVGHYFFSFRSSASHLQALAKFLLTAITGFLFNTFILYLLIHFFGYESIIFVVFAVACSAGLVYLISNYWVFVLRE